MLSTAGFGQTTISKNIKLEAQIIALDKSGWEAWKNKDATWFQTNTTEEFLSISSDGISTKADVIKSVPVDCNIKSYSLDDFKVIMLDKKTIVLTYVTTQDGICGGKKIPAQLRVSATYVKRGEKWLEAVYMETAIQ